MKELILPALLAFAVALLAPQILQAQGTTYLSNLDQSSVGSLAVGSDSWVDGIFNTGLNPGGYVLDSIELDMANAVGNPGDLQVMIYAPSGGAFPVILLGTLNGSLDPVTAGIYTYTPDAPITLLPNGPYNIVVTAGTAVADGAYEWSYAGINSYNPSGGGYTLPGGLAGAWTSSNGSFPWTRNGGAFPQFAVNATEVPEPGVLSLFVLGGFLLVRHRRKAKAV